MNEYLVNSERIRAHKVPNVAIAIPPNAETFEKKKRRFLSCTIPKKKFNPALISNIIYS